MEMKVSQPMMMTRDDRRGNPLMSAMHRRQYKKELLTLEK